MAAERRMQDRTDGLTAGLNMMVAAIVGRRNRKLISEVIGLANQLLIISFSDKEKALTAQEKNIDTVAFGLIAMVKIRTGILRDKKPLILQGSMLLVILGVTLLGRRNNKFRPGGSVN